MFKPWRSVKKKKIKATFKLQFQATQVPRLKKPALILSLMPEDVGKTTFKLKKAAVQDGIWSWDNPVYVTMILINEPKSGKLHEKIYHFIASSGSSKSGYLGEASIDFADFADETEPLSVSLPLKFANSGAVLHVTIQKMQGDFDPRKIEDYEDPILSKDRNLKDQLSNDFTDDNDESFSEDQDLDIVLSEQDSSFRSSTGGNSSFESTLRQDSIPPKGAVDGITRKHSLHCRKSTDWSMGSVSDGSLVDSTNSPEENLPRELQETSDESIEKLRSELSNLTRHLELSELELQSLRKQIAKQSREGQDLSRHVKELEEERDSLKKESELELQSLRKQITKVSRRGQDLSRHVKVLEQERDALKTECEQLKCSKKCVEEGESLNQLRAENEDSRVQLEEVRRELSHQKELNTNLKSQLQKTQDSNAELILAMGDLDEMLDLKNAEISSLSSKLDEAQEKFCKCSMKEDTDQLEVLALEQKTREANELCLLKQRVIGVHRETREKLVNYIEQLTQDCEDLKRENHDISSKLEERELQEHKTSATIKKLESHVQGLEEKLKTQTREFSESLLSINELENRMLKNEIETLRKEKNDISEQEKEVRLRDETEKLKASSEETEILTEIRKSERDEIEEIFAMTKEAMVKNLSLELQGLIDLQIELKNSLYSEEQEKEKLQQQALALKGKLLKTEQANNSLMKKLTFSVEKNSVPLDEKMQIKCAATGTTDVNDFQKINIGEDFLNSEMHTAGSKGIEREAKTCSKEELRVGTFNLMDEGKLIELLTEMAQLKERNKCMEIELREMQERYSEMSLKFAEVEGERQQLVMTVRNLNSGKRS